MDFYLSIFFRTIFMYLVILIVFRLMGKREVGELGILDMVVFVMIGEMAVLSIEKSDESLLKTLVPIMVLMLIQLLFSYLTLKSQMFRNIVDGKPSLIINKGKVDEKAMKKQRYNFDDLLTQLREQNIINIHDVEYAILETNGQLSVIEKDKISLPMKSGPYPLILDGIIQKDGLLLINKSHQWLDQELKKKGYDDEKSISFCCYLNGKLYVDDKS
jgi:uncharacterized membrane protein YcaP (DUF421 family)